MVEATRICGRDAAARPAGAVLEQLWRFPDQIPARYGGSLLYDVVSLPEPGDRMERFPNRTGENNMAEDEKRQELVESAASCQAAVFAAIDAVVATHIEVLLAKRRKTTYRDDYGREKVDAWWNEVLYFYDNIVMPELQARDLLGSIATMEINWVCNEHEFPDVVAHFGQHETIAGFFAKTVCLHIDETVEATARSVVAGGSTGDCDVSGMSPTDYERYCAAELVAAGWDARVVAGSGDQGVDIVACRSGITAVFQCKLYSRPLSNKAIQEVHAGRLFHNAAMAAVVSNAGFSPGARMAAEQTGVHLLHHSQLRTLGYQ